MSDGMIDERAMKAANNMAWHLLKYRYKEKTAAPAFFLAEKIVRAYVEALCPPDR